MTDEAQTPDPKPVEKTREALEKAIATIKTPAQADRVIEELEQIASGTKAVEVAAQTPPSLDANEAAKKIQQASNVPEPQKPQIVINEIAAQIAAADQTEDEELLSKGVQKATNPELQQVKSPRTDEERKLLQEALLRRLKPLQKIDAAAFIAINNLQHPRVANDFFFVLTTAFNRGDAWVAGLILAALRDSSQRRVLLDVLPALWMTAGAVEGPIKQVFRRQRPFSSIVRAIVVGRKPGNYSFPSGHSAAAFAGAYLLHRHYPHLAPLFYFIASLVGFSRVYLGAHYPGDVLSGAAFGVGLAEAFRRLSQEIAEAIDD